MTIEGLKTRYIYTGDIFVSHEPYLLTTVLGSCVAICIWDSALKAGGICHFAAPVWDAEKERTNRFGDIAVKALIDMMLEGGCRKKDMVAKVFGGGEVINVTNPYVTVPMDNIETAEKILKEEEITIATLDVGDIFGRKLRFNTHDGTVSVKKVNSLSARAAAIEMSGPIFKTY